MKKYYCDICGKEMSRPNVDEIKACAAAAAAVVEDVCPRCLEAGGRINVRGMILKQWQALVGVGQTPQTRANGGHVKAEPARQEYPAARQPEMDRPKRTVPRPAAAAKKADDTPGGANSGSPAKESSSASNRKPGQHWAEKRRIMGELRGYREANGLGSLYALAKAADLDADVLRQMLNAKPYPIDIWQRVDKGLQKLQGSKTAEKSEQE